MAREKLSISKFQSEVMDRMLGSGESSGDSVVLFRVGGTDYGVPSSQVEIVVDVPEDFVPVPIGAAWVLGVASVAGNVAICSDLSRMFDGHAAPIGSTARILIPAKSVGAHVGLLVNRVWGWERDAEVGLAPGGVAEWITGYGEVRGRKFTCIDLAKLLSSDVFLNAGSPVFAGQAGVDVYAARVYEKL